MVSRFTEVIVDCHDPERLVAFWSAVLGYGEVSRGDGYIAIGPPEGQASEAALRRAAQPPLVSFVLVPEAKAVKNRLHLDVTPVACSRDEEVLRLLGLGARHADIGQGETPWVVMADPEGNEFCVLSGLEDNRGGPEVG